MKKNPKYFLIFFNNSIIFSWYNYQYSKIEKKIKLLWLNTKYATIK